MEHPQMYRTATFALAIALSGTLSAQAENVEIYLTDLLDSTQNGYCLDIARAQGAAANPDDGLQGHTCYSPSGSLGVDQAFDSAQFTDGTLYMPEFNVCAVAIEPAAGSSIGLASCDDSEAQSFVFTGTGSISPATAPDLCMTLAEDTRSGRSDANQIKVLSLETCDTTRASYQDWAVRSSAE